MRWATPAVTWTGPPGRWKGPRCPERHVKDFSQGSVEQLRVVNSQADIIEDVLNGYLDTLGDKGQERLDELDGTWMTSANGGSDDPGGRPDQPGAACHHHCYHRTA